MRCQRGRTKLWFDGQSAGRACVVGVLPDKPQTQPARAAHVIRGDTFAVDVGLGSGVAYGRIAVYAVIQTRCNPARCQKIYFARQIQIARARCAGCANVIRGVRRPRQSPFSDKLPPYTIAPRAEMVKALFPSPSTAAMLICPSAPFIQ